MQEFVDFRVEIGDLDASGFRVSALSAVGETPEPVSVRFSWPDVAPLLEKLESRRIYAEELLDLGAYLGQLLLPGAIRDLFIRALTGSGEDCGVRIRLVVRDAQLAALPWEYAHVNLPIDQTPLSPYLLLHPQISLVRHDARPAPFELLRPANHGKLRVVVACASNVAGYPRLSDREPALIAQAVEEGRLRGSISLTVVEEPITIEGLRAALRDGADVVQLSGHGVVAGARYLGSPPGVMVASTDGAEATELLDAATLAELLMTAGVRVALLNLCRSAARTPTVPWMGMAGMLVTSGIPAVIAMQYEIEDSHAVRFTQGFFDGIAHGLSLDAAVAVGRASTLELPALSDWGVPVVYTRSPDGILFNPAQVDERERDELESRLLQPPEAPAPAREPVVRRDTTALRPLPRLRGRALERRRLSDFLDRIVETNEGAMAIVSGEAGTGKSALVQDCAGLARALDFEVVVVNCEPFHSGLSMFPIREVLRGVLRSELSDATTSSMFDAAPTEGIGAPGAARSEGSDLQRVDTMRAMFANALVARTQRDGGWQRPLLVVIEDLEHADTGTVDCLLCLLGRLPEAPIGVVGTYRTDLVPTRGDVEHPISPLLQRVLRMPTCLRMELGAMARSEFGGLVESLLDAPCRFDRRFLERLYEQTQGNPLFAREILLGLSTSQRGSEPVVVFRDGAWQVGRSVETWEVPDSLEAAIERRLSNLARDERTELELAAVIGRRFAFEVLENLSSAENDRLYEYFSKFLTFDLVREIRGRDDSFEFSHGMVRDVLYASMLSLRRRRLHGQVADVLSRLGRRQVDEDWDALLGEHLFQAARFGEALPLLLESARRSERALSHSSAILQYHRALEAIDAVGAPDDEDPDTIELELAVALKLDGRPVEAAALLTRLVGTLSDPATRGRALNHLGDVCLVMGDIEGAVDAYNECVRLAREIDDEALLLESVADLAELYGREIGRHLDPERADEARRSYGEWLTEHLTLAERATDRAVRARAARNKAMWHARGGRLDEALDAFDEALTLVEQSPEFHQSHVRVPLAKTLRLVGRTAEARDHIDDILKWSVEAGVGRSEAIARQYLGLLDMEEAVRSDRAELMADARDHLESALALHRELRFEQGERETVVDLGEWYVRNDDWTNALEAWSVVAGSTEPHRVVRSAIAELEGRGEHARAAFLDDACRRHELGVSEQLHDD